MQFTLDEQPTLLQMLLQLIVFLLIPVGMPLLLWLRRSPRNARDVLLAVARTPAGVIRRCVDFVGWLVSAVSLVGLQLLGMLGAASLVGVLMMSGSIDADEGPGWFASPVLAAGILLLAWMRLAHGPCAARDVLRITVRRTQ